MSDLVGTGALIKLALRLDRVKLPAWIAGLTFTVAMTASAFWSLYPTVAEREDFGATVAGNPTFRAVLGIVSDTSTVGGLTSWRVSVGAMILAGIMAHQTVVRHTRAEEESGRLELVGAGVVGRRASLAAALVVANGAGLVLGMLVALLLMGFGQDPVGSAAFGLQLYGASAVFAAVGALAAQVTVAARLANGIAGAVLGVAYLLRAVGDSSGRSLSWLSWLSPIGWAEQLRPFGQERWWVAGLMLALVVVLVAAAVAMADRRDLDAGVLAPGPGSARAGAWLRSPMALAWRLQQGLLLGWLIGAVVWSATIGTIGQGISELLENDSGMSEMMSRMIGEEVLIDALFANFLSIFGLAVSAYAVQALLRLRSEETGFRAELVLAADVGRLHWAASHLVIALVAPAVMMALGGAAMGLINGLQVGDVGGQLPKLAVGGLVQLPAIWVVVGVTTALYGLAPRFTSVTWAVLAAWLLLAQLGEILQLNQWLLNLSPFTHVPRYPGADLVWLPLAMLALVSCALTAAGLTGLRRRDLG
jgi:ABC-2 type transport system permease protein